MSEAQRLSAIKRWARPGERERRSQATCGKSTRGKGWHHSKETRDKIRIANTGKIPSVETRMKLSLTHRGKPAWNKGKSFSHEARARMSIASYAKWNDPNYRAKLSGQNSVHFIHGIRTDGYGVGYSYRLRRIVKERDNFTCQLCSRTRKETIIVSHHIDYDKNHNVADNLITLCQSCNCKVNLNREYWTRYFYNLMESRELITC